MSIYILIILGCLEVLYQSRPARKTARFGFFFQFRVEIISRKLWVPGIVLGLFHPADT